MQKQQFDMFFEIKKGEMFKRCKFFVERLESKYIFSQKSEPNVLGHVELANNKKLTIMSLLSNFLWQELK
jgi:hypothetical protein